MKENPKYALTCLKKHILDCTPMCEICSYSTFVIRQGSYCAHSFTAGRHHIQDASRLISICSKQRARICDPRSKDQALRGTLVPPPPFRMGVDCGVEREKSSVSERRARCRFTTACLPSPPALRLVQVALRGRAGAIIFFLVRLLFLVRLSRGEWWWW